MNWRTGFGVFFFFMTIILAFSAWAALPAHPNKMRDFLPSFFLAVTAAASAGLTAAAGEWD